MGRDQCPLGPEQAGRGLDHSPKAAERQLSRIKGRGWCCRKRAVLSGLLASLSLRLLGGAGLRRTWISCQSGWCWEGGGCCSCWLDMVKPSSG